MKTKGIIIGLSLALCLIAFFMRDWFLSFFTNEIIGENFLFNDSQSLSQQIFPTLIFVVSFGIIPFLYLFVRNYCKISSTKNQVLSLLTIIGSASIFFGMRVIYLKYKVVQLRDLLKRAEFTSDADIPGIDYQDMHLESYLMASVLIGCLLSSIIFKKSSNQRVL
ncbi:hypothetical protein [Sphingobacterium sp.]|uniref:hypothetical protein n=1 Tax=Sphingobacterium sp. TaxID=341027 RepID=UPI0028A1484D|nr:hypothetical protein [Sphingobacterium sp.]